MLSSYHTLSQPCTHRLEIGQSMKGGGKDKRRREKGDTRQTRSLSHIIITSKIQFSVLTQKTNVCFFSDLGYIDLGVNKKKNCSA